jgi:predicted DCC family thiol-disulfide oxidoreductase YuxK
MWLLSWMTILFEGTFFLVLLFPALAWIYIPAGVAFHVGIYSTMRAPFFQYIAIYAAFVPWARLIQTVSRRLKGQKASEKLHTLFDGQCPLCIRSMVILCYLDWFDRLGFIDLETRGASAVEGHPEISLEHCQREMHVTLPDGSVQKGFFAFRQIAWRVPFLWPLLVVFYLPLASRYGPKLYSWVASRRARFQDCSFETCSVHSNRE